MIKSVLTEYASLVFIFQAVFLERKINIKISLAFMKKLII
jgi:hypothetical protein